MRVTCAATNVSTRSDQAAIPEPEHLPCAHRAESPRTRTGAPGQHGRRGRSLKCVQLAPEPRFTYLDGHGATVNAKQEAQLAQLATQTGTDPGHLVMDAALRRLEDNQFRVAVIEGEQALQRGEYLSHEQVGQRLEKFLRT